MTLLIRDAQHNAPALDSGFFHRNWCQDSDFDGMARVLNGGRDADGIAEASNGDDLRRMYARTKNFVASRDVLLVEYEQEIIAYATCQWWIESSGKRVHRQRIEVLPMWRGFGIENTLLRRLEHHQRSMLQDYVANGLGWFEIELDDAQAWRKRGIGKALLVRSLKMFRDRGFDNTILAVNPDNPNGAQRLNASPGYKTVRHSDFYRKQM